LSTSEFYRDTWVEINVSNIKENVTNIKNNLPKNVGVCAVVKANGYGHGAVEVAHAAIEAGATAVAVALLDEALKLRAANITCPILVLGWTRPADAQIAIDNDVTLTIFQKEWALEAQHFITSGKVSVHIKVDTGMGRIGTVGFEETYELYETAQRTGKINIEGIFTHFATADELDVSYFHQQLQSFKTILSLFQKEGISFQTIHTSNSAASIRFPELAFTQVRVGIAMYGLSPSKEMKDLLPFTLKESFSLHSKIVHVKQLKAGDKVSYGAEYTAAQDEWIATIPVGYADGWLRKHSNKGEVIVKGKRVPIVGRVCMDQFMVKLTEKVNVGEEVILIGQQQAECISVDEVADRLETINYEIPIIISDRVPRVYVKKNTLNHLNK
jgi:alanine racemase